MVIRPFSSRRIQNNIHPDSGADRIYRCHRLDILGQERRTYTEKRLFKKIRELEHRRWRVYQATAGQAFKQRVPYKSTVPTRLAACTSWIAIEKRTNALRCDTTQSASLQPMYWENE